ncbi:hypothetical protein BDY24DRAFT_439936 [Mrakia frigida]|uniref:uncharacterized protein n=1 Tax=Mrakia frigida TaxID=29902 RepID=UPI003FCBF3FA
MTPPVTLLSLSPMTFFTRSSHPYPSNLLAPHQLPRTPSPLPSRRSHWIQPTQDEYGAPTKIELARPSSSERCLSPTAPLSPYSLRISTSFEKAASHPSSNNCPSSIFVSYALPPTRRQAVSWNGAIDARFRDFLGLESPPWPDLRSIEFVDVLLYEGVDVIFLSTFQGGTGLALRTHPFRNLVVRLDPLRFKDAPSLYHNLFRSSERSYPNIERIKMRLGIEIEMSIRREREETGLNALELRLGPLVVFVDEDGTETRLVED